MVNGTGGFQPVASSARMSTRSQLSDQFPGFIAHHRNRWKIRLRIAVDEIFSRRCERDFVIGVLRSQQLQAGAIEIHAVKVNEIRIATFSFPDAEKIQHTIFLVHAQKLRDVAFAVVI